MSAEELATRAGLIEGCRSSTSLDKNVEWDQLRGPQGKSATSFTLVICYIAIEHGPFIVDFPINSMVIFQFAM